MGTISRLLMWLLTRSAWLLPADRANWIEGLVAEAEAAGTGRARVAWLLGGVWLIASGLLRRSVAWVLIFITAAAIVLLIAWPGSSSDSAVLVNRIEIPVYLVVLALAPLLVRRHFGPVADGLLPRAVRVVGYAIVLALIAASAAEGREGQKLGAYFHAGGKLPGLIVIVLACYAAAILIITSQRVALIRQALAMAIGAGTLTGAALYSIYGYQIHNPPLAWWAFTALALPVLAGFAATRLAARDMPATGMTPAQRSVVVAGCATAVAALWLLPPPSALVVGGFLALFLVTGTAAKQATAKDRAETGMTPAGQGALVAVSVAATAVLMLAALTTVTIALAPNRVPLQTPPPPPNGGCETCSPVSLVVPPDLRHEYWVGVSVAQASLPYFAALVVAPVFALFGGGLGVGLGEASLSVRKRFDSPGPAPPPEPSQTQA